MEKYLVFLGLLTLASGQRPTYAGSRPVGKPDLASRFKGDNNASDSVTVANRVGEDGTTKKIPVDARGDGELVDRLSQWPREHQPFWLINAEHIEAQRNPNRNNPQLNPALGNSNPAIGNFNPSAPVDGNANLENRNNFPTYPDSFQAINDLKPGDFPGNLPFNNNFAPGRALPPKPFPVRGSFFGPLH